eukprot:6780268-Prymnesium_polylepis.1
MPPMVPQNVNNHDACLSNWTTVCNQPWLSDSKCAWFAAKYTKTLTRDFGITNRSVLDHVAAVTSCVDFFRTWEAACISANRERAVKASHSCPSFTQASLQSPRSSPGLVTCRDMKAPEWCRKKRAKNKCLVEVAEQCTATCGLCRASPPPPLPGLGLGDSAARQLAAAARAAVGLAVVTAEESAATVEAPEGGGLVQATKGSPPPSRLPVPPPPPSQPPRHGRELTCTAITREWNASNRLTRGACCRRRKELLLSHEAWVDDRETATNLTWTNLTSRCAARCLGDSRCSSFSLSMRWHDCFTCSACRLETALASSLYHSWQFDAQHCDGHLLSPTPLLPPPPPPPVPPPNSEVLWNRTLIAIPMVVTSRTNTVDLETAQRRDARLLSVAKDLARHRLLSSFVAVDEEPASHLNTTHRTTVSVQNVLLALERCRTLDSELCLIYEDDASLHPRFVTELRRALATLPAAWQVFHLCPGCLWGRRYLNYNANQPPLELHAHPHHIVLNRVSNDIRERRRSGARRSHPNCTAFDT